MKKPSMHPLVKVNQKKLDLENYKRSIAEAVRRKVEKEKKHSLVLWRKA